jgi:membrane protease subunit HflK
MRLQLGNQIIDLNFPSGQFKAIAGIGILALLVFLATNSFYTVKVEEEAVVTRFGEYQETVGPGLHFMIPFVDKAEKLEVRRQLELEFGVAPQSSNSRSNSRSSQSQVEQERDMVTGDLNAALVSWVIQYRISDPFAYLFKVRNPDETLRDASESVMREVVGDRTVDEVITFGRQEIESTCQEKLGVLAEQYELGLVIDQVQLKDVLPPREVQASFNEVNQAQQDKEKEINIANGKYNGAVPKAGGDADKMISEAQGYATKRVNEAQGDVAKFVALFKEYEKSPEVTRRRIYLETMEKVMPQLGKTIVIDEGANQVLPLLPLGTNGLTK